jgi:hypothetical protein
MQCDCHIESADGVVVSIFMGISLLRSSSQTVELECHFTVSGSNPSYEFIRSLPTPWIRTEWVTLYGIGKTLKSPTAGSVMGTILATFADSVPIAKFSKQVIAIIELAEWCLY